MNNSSLSPTPGGSNGNGSKAGASLDDLSRQGQRIQEIIEKIESTADPAARAMMQECMESVLAFYGKGLTRILQVMEGHKEAYNTLINDGIVRGLLLIHGLHPLSLETRLHQALDKVRPYMESHGGSVELISLDTDVAYLRLHGSCKSCPSSAVTMELALRGAIEEACPDLMDFHVEGVAPGPHVETAPRGSSEWTIIEGARDLREGEFFSVHAGGAGLIICRLGQAWYAYRDQCPACNLPLHLGALNHGTLSCRAGHTYDVRLAGRALDNPHLHLDPFPLLVEDVIKVSVPP